MACSGRKCAPATASTTGATVASDSGATARTTAAANAATIPATIAVSACGADRLAFLYDFELWHI